MCLSVVANIKIVLFKICVFHRYIETQFVSKILLNTTAACLVLHSGELKLFTNVSVTTKHLLFFWLVWKLGHWRSVLWGGLGLVVVVGCMYVPMRYFFLANLMNT